MRCHLEEWLDDAVRFNAARARRLGMAKPMVQQKLRRTDRIHLPAVAKHLGMESLSGFEMVYEGRSDKPGGNRRAVGGGRVRLQAPMRGDGQKPARQL